MSKVRKLLSERIPLLKNILTNRIPPDGDIEPFNDGYPYLIWQEDGE